jgi:glycosyltransferase involved in cell wall biosynthesis
MNAKLRILLWSPKGASLAYYGGTSTPAYRLYRQRDADDADVVLAHASGLQPAHPEAFQEQVCIGRLHHAPKPRVFAGVVETARKLSFLRRSTAWLGDNAGRFDVFHGIGAQMDVVAPAACASRLGLPAVVTTTIASELTAGSTLKAALGVHRRRIARLKELAAVVAISRQIQELLIDAGIAAERIVNLPLGGVDTTAFRPLADKLDRPRLRGELGLADRSTCLFAGGIVERKRPHLLVEAMAHLRSRGLDAQLVLVGPEHEPAYAEEMRRRAAELGLEDRIIWYGFTTEMLPLYHAADVVCLPSTNEGLPGVIMEAMAAGVPCVYTDISGARDLIANGSDGAVIAADGSGLGEALAAYLAQPQRMRTHGAAARRRAEAEFSNAAVWRRYLRVFDNVRNRRPPKA